MEQKKLEIAIFGAGCFWGVESRFGKVKGVVETEVGYTGGTTKNPSYKDVCTNKTGHAEVVKVTFDPSIVSYEELLEIFWNLHNPTSLNRQGWDVGTQYRSAVFYNSEEQRLAALKLKEDLDKSGKYNKPIVTEIIPVSEYYRAEEYHQKYDEKNKRSIFSI
ncbi:MAG: peptide-methionine (S)-S-oxide reductase MsrA [Candidatus Lokiarchaeota archaeon]|nr:peptide-methionine (S)-S-oxide reductase MsrA [Candidatus Lokiarchaeota archaeon]